MRHLQNIHSQFLENSLQNKVYIQHGNWNSKIENGKLFVGFTTQRIRDRELQTRKELFTSSLILILLVFFLATLISYNVAKPLSRLVDLTKKIAEGDYEARSLEKHGNFEIKSLATSFNMMMDKLVKIQNELSLEKKKSDELLLNILPFNVAERLKNGESTISESHDNVTVLFLDLVGFTKFSSQNTAVEIVKVLNEIFSYFDDIVKKNGLEKIKTIGDTYMACCGLYDHNQNHAVTSIVAASEMFRDLKKVNEKHGISLQARVGLHSGHLIAGVIGKSKIIYDVWGDTVNTSSRMESHGKPSMISISEETYKMVQGKIQCIPRGEIEIKGKGKMKSYFIDPKNPFL